MKSYVKLAELVMDNLRDYTEDVQQEIRKITYGISEECKEKLKLETYPSATKAGTADPTTRRMWKQYAKNWTVDHENGVNFSKAYVHNKKTYRLTHLLENGHSTREGTHTRGFAHIKPIYMWAQGEYHYRVREAIEKNR